MNHQAIVKQAFPDAFAEHFERSDNHQRNFIVRSKDRNFLGLGQTVEAAWQNAAELYCATALRQATVKHGKPKKKNASSK